MYRQEKLLHFPTWGEPLVIVLNTVGKGVNVCWKGHKTHQLGCLFIFFIISVFKGIFSITVHRDPYKSPVLILSYACLCFPHKPLLSSHNSMLECIFGKWCGTFPQLETALKNDHLSMSNKKPGARVGHKYKLGKTLKSCFKTAVLFFPPLC